MGKLYTYNGSSWDEVTGSVGPQGPQGETGAGFTGGSYDTDTGVVTFTSDDGLGFSTEDLRGEMSGPASSTDNALVRFDGTTGRVIQNGVVTANDAGNIDGVNSINYNGTASGAFTAAGDTAYNSDRRTFDVALGNGVIANLPNEIQVDIQNDTGSTIANGTVIQLVGTVGASGIMRGKPAVLSEITSPRQILGLATEDIANGAMGKVTRVSEVNNLNTSTMAVEAPIYLSTTAGVFTTTEPTAPNLAWELGLVTASHAVVGKVQVNVLNIPHRLENLADVNGTAPVDGSFLAYDATNGYHDFTANVSDFATAAQGALADTSVQPGDVIPLADGGTGTSLVDPNADRIMFWDDSAGATAYLTASTGLTLSGTSLTVRSSSTTQTGIIETATTAEATAGTDTSRAVTAAGVQQFYTDRFTNSSAAKIYAWATWGGK